MDETGRLLVTIAFIVITAAFLYHYKSKKIKLKEEPISNTEVTECEIGKHELENTNKDTILEPQHNKVVLVLGNELETKQRNEIECLSDENENYIQNSTYETGDLPQSTCNNMDSSNFERDVNDDTLQTTMNDDNNVNSLVDVASFSTNNSGSPSNTEINPADDASSYEPFKGNTAEDSVIETITLEMSPVHNQEFENGTLSTSVSDSIGDELVANSCPRTSSTSDSISLLMTTCSVSKDNLHSLSNAPSDSLRNSFSLETSFMNDTSIRLESLEPLEVNFDWVVRETSKVKAQEEHCTDPHLNDWIVYNSIIGSQVDVSSGPVNPFAIMKSSPQITARKRAVKKVDEVSTEMMKPSMDNAMTKKRQLALSELLQTEESFVQHLQSLDQLYLQPLLQSTKKSSLLTTAEFETIFGGLVSIQLLHKQHLLPLLQNSLENVGCHFVQLHEMFLVYSDYIVKMDEAIQLWQSRLSRNSKLVDFVQSRKSLPAHSQINLESYLLLPFQRLTRYTSLLEAVAKYTSLEHPDYSFLRNSIDLMGKTVMRINEKKRAYENLRRLHYVNDHLKKYPYHLMKNNRTILTEISIPILRVESIGHQVKAIDDAYLFLLSDGVLLHCRRKAKDFVFVEQWKLSLDDVLKKEELRLIVSGRASLEFTGLTSNEKLKWIHSLSAFVTIK